MKKGAVIGIICGILAVGIAGIGVSAAMILNSPSVKITRGFTKLINEYADSGSDVKKALGCDKLDLQEISDKYQVVFDAEVYDVEGLEDFSVGLDGLIQCDYENEKIKEEFSISLSYYELLSMQFAIDKTDVYIDIPALYDGSICFDSQNIDEQFNNSIFKNYFGTEIGEELSFDIFQNNPRTLAKSYSKLPNDVRKLIKNAKIEKADDALVIQIGEQSVNCKGYVISIKKDDINALLKSYYEETGVTEESYLFDSDLEVLVYMDSKCNIKQIQTEEDIRIEGMDEGISVAIRLLGEKNAFDAMKVKIGTEVEGEDVEMDYAYSFGMEEKDAVLKLQLKAKTDETDLIGLDYDIVLDTESSEMDLEAEVNIADTNMKIDGTGEMKADDATNTLEVSIQECDVIVDGEEIGSFDMSMRYEPLSEEINISPKKTYPIFEFTEDDFSSFVLTCYENLEEYSKMFEGLEDLY